jgi:hypothetical protein
VAAIGGAGVFRAGVPLSLLVAALALPRPARGAPELVWLAPDRVAHGLSRIGLTILSDGRAARPDRARVSVQGASLEELPPQGVARVFALGPNGPAVVLRAEQADLAASVARVEVGPPSARVAIAASPAAPVKGRDREVALEIAVLRGDGTPDPNAPPPVLRANVGEVTGLSRIDAGRFAAHFVLPQQRYPEVAIVVAFAPWPHADSPEGALGAAVIPLSASVSLPGKTEPDVAISVEIAGKTFGPVRSDAGGRFEVPVVVPPGHRFGTSRATDRAGNSRTKAVDLHLPPTDQIACVANPASLPADGSARAKVLCVVTDPFGAPAASAAIVARARAGRLAGPRLLWSGGYEWEYVAPDAVGSSPRTRGPLEERPSADRFGSSPEELRFEYPAGGPQSSERLGLNLTGLALASVALRVEPQPVFAGGSAGALLSTRDARGRPAAARVDLRAARGALDSFAPDANGAYRASYQAPLDAGDWTDSIAGRVLPAAGAVAARIDLSASDEGLLARATALDGAPVEGLALAAGEARGTTGPDGVARFAMPAAARSGAAAIDVRALERPSLRALGWLLPTAQGSSLFPDAGPFTPLVLEVPIGLAPATPVDVRLEILGSDPPAVRVRALDSRGQVMRDRELALELARPSGARVAHGPGQPQPDGSVLFAVTEKVSGPVLAAAIDVVSGVSASREARLP